MIDHQPPFDRARHDHENQPVDDEDTDDSLDIKRKRKTALRASQGDRTDWKQHLDMAPGCRHVPDDKMTLAKKRIRSASIRAAAVRRTKRRDELGIALHYIDAAWRRLSPAQRGAFDRDRKSLAFVGPRWDAEHHFGWWCADILDHLFRFGTRKARPRQTYISYMRETGRRPEGWYVT